MVDLNSALWTAIVAAGDRPGADSLAAHFEEKSKALIGVGGEAMLSRVVRALLASSQIGRVVILSQDGQSLIGRPDTNWLADHDKVTFATSQSSLSGSIASMIGTAAAPWPVLLTTADHPLLTPTIIDYFLAHASDVDLAVGMVDRAVVFAKFHQSKRTWLEFSNGGFTGANLFAFHGEKANAALMLWVEIEARRKSPLAVLSRFGPWLLFRALTRTISLESGIRKAGRKLEIRAKPVTIPYAEAAIDVDKLADHTLAEAILSGAI